jgi:hypothetical protein
MNILTTPAGIRWFHMRAQLSALKLENFGMKHSKGNVYKHISKIYNLTGSRAVVAEKFERLVKEAEQLAAQG